ncbi:serine/threonine-protein kinase [Aldersonia kunmingensis]|uniref:serine/threonine-protein kinase n=1 Tax=Aldersonia kunmingensis TaxID=408066 RepID=UPI0008344764|nr:serine/threonine-protein kinase [Aldersonia kunmingensis]
MSRPELLGGRYEVRDVLGRGGMAEVRAGWDTRLGRAVAIKRLYPMFCATLENRRRFEAEARSAAALNHPNIVAVHDSGEHDQTPYIVMERLPGGTLADEIAHGPLPQQQVCTILCEVLDALTAAHDAGILHRDIKPGNVLFTNGGQVKVADFGIAKTSETDHTSTGLILGTLPYLSPDRLAGEPATVSDDLYALGVVGYEALTARKPFAREHPAATARAIVEDRPIALADIRPDVDPVLASVIERAMSRDPVQRFGSARDMRAAMPSAPGPVPIPVSSATRPFTAGPPGMLPLDTAPPRVDLGAPPEAGRHGPRIVWLIAGLAIAVVIAVALAVAAIGQDDSAPPNTGTTDTTLPAAVSAVPEPAGPALTGVPPPPPGSPPAEQPNGNGNGKNKEKNKEKGNGGG